MNVLDSFWVHINNHGFFKTIVAGILMKFKAEKPNKKEDMTITPLPVDLLSPGDLCEFAQRLKEARTWCQMRIGRANARQVFRSQELKPEKLDSLDKAYKTMEFEEMRDVVTRFSKRRRELLKSVPDISQSSLATEGKLLACFYADSVIDTASESVSNLFIDGWDRPPWDTWIWCHDFPYSAGKNRRSHPAIISWVPTAFVEPDVYSAIDANLVSVLRWFSEEKNELAEQLRAQQLLV